jgi:hypothetical protein
LLLGPAHVTNLLQKNNNYNRPKLNSPDEHRSIGPGPVVAAIVGEPHAMHVLVWLCVHGGGLKYFQEHANNYNQPIFFKSKLVTWAGSSNNEFTLKKIL